MNDSNNKLPNGNHEKIKKILKIVGAILLAIGIVCSIIGLIDFFSCFGTSKMPTRFFLCFIGFPLIAAGGGMLLFGFQRELARYNKNENVPVFNEFGKEISPAVQHVAHSVQQGLDEKIVCSCGTENDKDSAYCKKCGKQLSDTCPYCGEAVDADSEFCNHCGKRIH